ncbi:hypothetical protein EB796_020494 [Bugula neritina]|uniref:Uncharacterized protein n=1 Tax=Bugula neritina TaxID=10212 RepID=A0A7J7J5Q0_BUGNE|nr:hypothetical protein EB796_020494 [Bugula neritina]
MISYDVWISQNFVTKHKLNKVHMENTPGKDIVGNFLYPKPKASPAQKYRGIISLDITKSDPEIRTKI